DGGGIAPHRRRGGLRAPALAARSADPGDCLELATFPRDAARRGARIRPRQWHRRGRRGLYRGRSAVAKAARQLRGAIPFTGRLSPYRALLVALLAIAVVKAAIL